jgi:hypothetical protein
LKDVSKHIDSTLGRGSKGEEMLLKSMLSVDMLREVKEDVEEKEEKRKGGEEERKGKDKEERSRYDPDGENKEAEEDEPGDKSWDWKKYARRWD